MYLWHEGKILLVLKMIICPWGPLSCMFFCFSDQNTHDLHEWIIDRLLQNLKRALNQWTRSIGAEKHSGQWPLRTLALCGDWVNSVFLCEVISDDLRCSRSLYVNSTTNTGNTFNECNHFKVFWTVFLKMQLSNMWSDVSQWAEKEEPQSHRCMNRCSFSCFFRPQIIFFPSKFNWHY